MIDSKLANGGRIFLLMFCLLSSHQVSAGFQDNNGDGQAESWPSPQFTFYTGSLLGETGLWEKAFQEAANRWNDAATDFEIITVSESSLAGRCTLTGNNTAYFSDDICGDEFGTGVLAVATNSYIPGLNRYTKSEIIFNIAEPWNVYDGNQKSSENDFRRVAIHELGHSMGLDHSARQDSIMFAFIGNIFIPQIEEVNFIKANYGNKFFTLKINVEGKGKVAILPKVLGTGVVNNNIFYTSSYSNFLDCNEDPCVIAIQEGLRLSIKAIAANGGRFIGWDGTTTQSRAVELRAFDGNRTLTARFTGSPATDADKDKDGIGDRDDNDDDNDGVLDVNDAFPLDSSESVDTDSDRIGNNADIDDDNDGVLDINDAFPLDSSESVDTDGDRVGNNADIDDDNDEVLDVDDTFPLDSAESVDTDSDRIGNNADIDDDNDGVQDVNDAFPLDSSESVDTDGDRVGNNADTDDDNDGVKDTYDAFPLDASVQKLSSGLPIWLLKEAKDLQAEQRTN